jgi:hypothetical protein
LDKLRIWAEYSVLLYSLLYTEEGIVVLTLHEIEVRQ